MLDLLEELRKCSRCGFCQEVCPTYKVDFVEGGAARGRLRLAKIVEEGKYEWNSDNKISTHINDCLLCGACVANCPGAIPTNELMIEARQKINKNSGTPLFYKIAYKGALSNHTNLNIGRKFMRMYQVIRLRKLVEASGVLKLLPAIKAMEERMPVVQAQSFFEALPGLGVVVKNSRRVAYFCGCATNSFFGDVGISTVKVLRKLGYDVYAPQPECCGEPHKSAGDLEEAKRLARRNIDIFLAGPVSEHIVTDCATCGSALKGYGKLLADDERYRDKAATFSASVLDLNEFLVDKTDALENLTEAGGEITVTFHDPCHLARGQKLAGKPREILRTIPGVKFVEMVGADSCCGGAGSYGFTHHRLSKKILESKMANAKATGADVLSTACPACMMQLSYGIMSEKSAMRLLHPVQLLEVALPKKTRG